jgi:hypothetical protein
MHTLFLSKIKIMNNTNTNKTIDLSSVVYLTIMVAVFFINL